eukprot:262703-Pleurochrysis_carterae.AAC.1
MPFASFAPRKAMPFASFGSMVAQTCNRSWPPPNRYGRAIHVGAKEPPYPFAPTTSLRLHVR